MIRRLERVSEERNGQKSARILSEYTWSKEIFEVNSRTFPWVAEVNVIEEVHDVFVVMVRQEQFVGEIVDAHVISQRPAKRSGAAERHTFEVPQRLGRIVKRYTLEESFYICLGGCQNEEQRRSGAGD